MWQPVHTYSFLRHTLNIAGTVGSQQANLCAGKGDLFGSDMKLQDPISISGGDVRSLAYCELLCISTQGLAECLQPYPAFTDTFLQEFPNDLTYNLREGHEDFEVCWVVVCKDYAMIWATGWVGGQDEWMEGPTDNSLTDVKDPRRRTECCCIFCSFQDLPLTKSILFAQVNGKNRFLIKLIEPKIQTSKFCSSLTLCFEKEGPKRFGFCRLGKGFRTCKRPFLRLFSPNLTQPFSEHVDN